DQFRNRGATGRVEGAVRVRNRLWRTDRVSDGICADPEDPQTVFHRHAASHAPADARLATLIVTLFEQPELRGIAARFRKAEMPKRVTGQQPPPRRALHEAFLDQERLDDLLDRVARLGERSGDGLDADRTATVILGDHGQISPI